MDADAACQLPRTAALDSDLCDLDLLCPPRSGPIRWVLGARPLELGDGRYSIQLGHTGLLWYIHAWRSGHRYFSFAAVGPVHVGALSHPELERHQLFSKAGTWRGLRSESVFHVCCGRSRSIGLWVDS